MALVSLFSQKGSDRRDPHQAKPNDIIWLNAENARYSSKMVKNIKMIKTHVYKYLMRRLNEIIACGSLIYV